MYIWEDEVVGGGGEFLTGGAFIIFSVLTIYVVLATMFTPIMAEKISPLGNSLMSTLLPPYGRRVFKASGVNESVFSEIVCKTHTSLSTAFNIITLVFLIKAIAKILTKCFKNIVSTIVVQVTSVVLTFPKLMLTLTITNVVNTDVGGTVVTVMMMD